MENKRSFLAACAFIGLTNEQTGKLEAFLTGYEEGSRVKPLVDNIDLVILQLNNLTDVGSPVREGSKTAFQVNKLRKEVEYLQSLKLFLTTID
ncbi:hypothetical protein [Elizabethkingia anophelis]|uniref:hypothetical protein n=1 Tax=Elizabethkingia anophelis TaxID=1117645 RepID=UPI001629873D|nr:hypothetical protein [Elizabethkingia anophelis]MCT4321798.1 hypothetical protein [Elizabethkingia anophelis]